MKSNLPDPTGGNVDATGAYDHAAKIFEELVTLTGTSDDGTLHRIVFGTDSYSRTRETDKWVHLDLARLKSQVRDAVQVGRLPLGLEVRERKAECLPALICMDEGGELTRGEERGPLTVREPDLDVVVLQVEEPEREYES